MTIKIETQGFTKKQDREVWIFLAAAAVVANTIYPLLSSGLSLLAVLGIATLAFLAFLFVGKSIKASLCCLIIGVQALVSMLLWNSVAAGVGAMDAVLLYMVIKIKVEDKKK
jgi:hypothetical protein